MTDWDPQERKVGNHYNRLLKLFKKQATEIQLVKQFHTRHFSNYIGMKRQSY